MIEEEIYESGDETLEEGEDDNYEEEDEEFDPSELEESVKKGDAEAMFNLGWRYQGGDGVKKDMNKAIELFEQSFKLGNKDAMRQLGWIYQYGEENDLKKAKEFYETAASFGFVDAINQLGTMYLNGKGVDKNPEKALELFEKAKKLGCVSSINQIAFMYENGVGFEKNVKKAIELYEEAAKKTQDSSALDRLCVLYLENKEYEKLKIAYNFLIKNGSAKAMNLYAIMLENGEGVKQDYNEAIKLYKRAIKLGSDDAMYNLGCLYEEGKGVDQDYEDAIKLYEMAVELENVNAMVNLGMLYLNGQGVKQDYKKAFELFEKGSELDTEGDCINNLGLMYQNGEGVKKDYVKAKELFEEAIDIGNTNAMNSLGMMYQYGHGVKKDFDQAITLFKSSIKGGDIYTKFSLGFLYYLKKDYKESFDLFIESKKEFSVSNYILGLMYEKGNGVEQDLSKSFYYYQEFNKHVTKDDLLRILRRLDKEDFEHYTHLQFIYSKLESLDFDNKIKYKNASRDLNEYFKKILIKDGKTEKEVIEIFEKINYFNFMKMIDHSKEVIEKYMVKFHSIEIMDQIQSGGYSVVYKGLYLFKDVALKHIKCVEDSHKKVFYQEVETLMKLDYPYVIKCHGWTFKQENYYIILELMENNLFDALNDLDRPEKLECLLKIAEGMNFLHKCGIYHRDLKPENILLKGNDLKISDFGFSHILTQEAILEMKNNHKSTLKGSLYYIAPELFESPIYSEKTDVFSYAMIIYFLFEKKHPFYENEKDFIINFSSKILRPDIQELNSFVNKEIKELMEECWDQNPINRPSFEMIIEKLENILFNTSVYDIEIK